MFVLKMAAHLVKPEHRQIVEAWNGEVFMGAIYPTEKGIKVDKKKNGF